MMRILALAMNTFREAVRDKVLYSLLFFSLLLIGFAVVINDFTVGQQSKILVDMGLASIEIFGVLIAIAVGVGLVYKEIEKRTIYAILSKPIHRYEFILGKYLGLVLTLAVEVLIMTGAFLAALALYGVEIHGIILAAVGFIFLKICVITAVAILFSSFSTPFLSGLFTLSIYIIGHLLSDLKEFGERKGAPVVTGVLYFVFPNLENFNLKKHAVYNLALDMNHVGWAIPYALLYVMFLLTVSAIFFRYREFK